MSFAQNRTLLRSITNTNDNLDVDVEEAIAEGQVEITIGARAACEESQDFLEQAIVDGNGTVVDIAQASCDSVCGETCNIGNVTETDSSANINFISATLFILMQVFMQHF